MGNSVSWVAQCLYPKDQVFWAAVHYNDVDAIRSATLRLTPETRRYLEWQEPETGRTALLEAAAKGYCECARMLIKAGANCNVKDLRMNTPLHFACKRAQSELVQLLLEVPTMIPFEVNLYMKTPLDIARKRFSTEEVEDEAQAYAKCIDLLEKSFYLYSGWLYEKTDNVLSYISRVSSLHSWTRRWCVVLERGDPDVLELAFFNKDSDGVRSVCPTSVMLYNVAAGSEVTNDSSWLSRKKFAFILRGDHLSQSHYRGPTASSTAIFHVSLLYNLLRKHDKRRPWWSQIEPNLLLGALPLRDMKHMEQLIQGVGVKAIVTMNQPIELLPNLISTPISPIEWENARIAQCFGSTEDFSSPTLETIEKCTIFIHEHVDMKQQITRSIRVCEK
ncbi:hypothetical protein PPTG_02340 [Plasmopara halstedii]|uniref:Uncharacterized protein n=1 Tax=Plasmopara halstedii TaxID=4781 RepID=A0A0P1AJW3_PLAHL|nr:hypothetical protein PPTG_02340 [Plasmopara halstedii]CEG41280.1 hypothetical protein PPTG_02340 [Plasmopara halstedii]|eukprot:XP_024577649.1 hypothetical protein PPTG_02340 [Plasmopara halstedii]